MEYQKYELLKDDAIISFGRTLYRIKETTDFGDVEKGELGGYIEKEENLSHFGNAWVADNARVTGNAWVADNAEVAGNAWVADNARVTGNAWVADNARVTGNAWVTDNAWVTGNAEVAGNARVTGNAWVAGNARVTGNAWVTGNARVTELGDVIVFENHWSSGGYFTYTKSNKMWKVGCFHGPGEELIAKAYKDSEVSGKHYESYVNLVLELEKIDG